jgi:hypothetical protein
MKSVVSVLLILASSASFARGLSATRNEGESYEDARSRHSYTRYYSAKPRIANSPEHMAKALRAIKSSEVPAVSSAKDLTTQFDFFRDDRYLVSTEPNFLRRIAWMFPDDGCFLRAELARLLLADRKFTAAKKIFAFGKLEAETKNSPTGSVQWWYHVALTYRVGDNIFVLDPSLNPSKPMTLLEWDAAIGGAITPVKYAVCSGGTFDPDDDCVNPKGLDKEDVVSDEGEYLTDEWARILELHRDPTRELGNFPPWLKN